MPPELKLYIYLKDTACLACLNRVHPLLSSFHGFFYDPVQFSMTLSLAVVTFENFHCCLW